MTTRCWVRVLPNRRAQHAHGLSDSERIHCSPYTTGIGASTSQRFGQGAAVLGFVEEIVLLQIDEKGKLVELSLRPPTCLRAPR